MIFFLGTTNMLTCLLNIQLEISELNSEPSRSYATLQTSVLALPNTNCICLPLTLVNFAERQYLKCSTDLYLLWRFLACSAISSPIS